MNFATDLPPLIDDLERVTQLSDSDNLETLQQDLLQQQEVLLKVKDYLVYLYDQGKNADQSDDLIMSSRMGDAGAIAAAVIQELQLKRTEWVAPISQELDQLSAQKQILEREIYRLNQQYENVLEHFPQQLLAHFQTLLQTQLSKSVELFEQRLRYISSVTHSMPGLEDAGFAASEAQVNPARTPMEHAQAVQHNLDQSLTNLDNTIQSVFGALEKDISSYQLSLTDDLRRLNGLQTTTEQATNADIVTAEELIETTEVSTPTPPWEPESPELQSVLDVEPAEAEVEPELAVDAPETLSLFGDDNFNYFETTAATEETGIDDSEAINTADASMAIAENSVQEDYLDFAASVTEEGLFGEGAIGTTEESLFGEESTDITDEQKTQVTNFPLAEDIEGVSAESLLFGDPLPEPETEAPSTDISDLQAAIATPTTDDSTKETDAPEETTVKTIQLLTDLLEDGSLNAQDNGEDEAFDPEAMDEEEEGSVEDLNPDFEGDEDDSPVLTVSVLDPEKMAQLTEDLERYEEAPSKESESAPENSDEID
ncbi:MAG: hypothetical protein WBB82_13970, partial [Limnothrix sp.]